MIKTSNFGDVTLGNLTITEGFEEETKTWYAYVTYDRRELAFASSKVSLEEAKDGVIKQLALKLAKIGDNLH